MKICSLHGRFQALLVVFWISFCAAGWAAPIEVTDEAGNRIDLDAVPRQVVSRVPSATEMIFAIGAGAAGHGLERHFFTGVSLKSAFVK